MQMVVPTTSFTVSVGTAALYATLHTVAMAVMTKGKVEVMCATELCCSGEGRPEVCWHFGVDII